MRVLALFVMNIFVVIRDHMSLDGSSCMHESAHSKITFHGIADGAARDGICGGVMLIIADPIHTNAAAHPLSLSTVSARLFD